MKNLAGNKQCDLSIAQELRKASIPQVALDCTQAEVPASIAGKLGSFTFKRAWYYWTVKGPMPLHIAKLMYRHPIGRRSIRVSGHCGRPHPNGWSTRRLVNGGQIWPLDQKEDFDAFIAEHPENHNSLDRDVFSDDKTLGLSYVDSYHIDTAEGLRLFAKMIRRFNLA